MCVTDCRFLAHSCCFKCGLPGDMCVWYRDGLSCKWGEVVVPVCLLAWLREDAGLREVIRMEAGRGFQDVESYCKWLIGSRVVMGWKTTNAFGLFVAILERRKEEEERYY